MRQLYKKFFLRIDDKNQQKNIPISMKSETFVFLNDILQTPSPSGFEIGAAKQYDNFMRKYVDEVFTDSMGNVIAHKKQKGSKKLMLIAHADEVGFMVTYIDNNGFIYFQPIGGIDVNLLPGIQVEIHNKCGKVIGVIGKKPKHLLKKDDGAQQLRFEDLWIDIGATSRDDAQSHVQIGDFITYKSSVIELCNNLLSSKSLDDKIGVAVLAAVAINLFGKESKYDLYLVASSQEELGARGSITVTNRIMPDECIAIDVTHANDYPHMLPFLSGEIKLGKGAVIALGPNISSLIGGRLKRLATEKEYKQQIQAIPYPTGTDARQVQVTGNGIPTALISIPCRYMHSPVEVVSTDDFDSVVNTLTDYCLLNNDETEI